MSDLAEFLLERIAEDEAAARMPPPGPWSFDGPVRETSVYSKPTGVTVAHVWQRDAAHIARWDPARVLAECEAKRRIWAHEMAREQSIYGTTANADANHVLRCLALPYADHRDYDPAWRI